MTFKAEIKIMPLAGLLDPQGKAVSNNMENINLKEISEVRIGKHITLNIDADSKAIAEEKVEDACKKLLCNQIMESYSYVVSE